MQILRKEWWFWARVNGLKPSSFTKWTICCMTCLEKATFPWLLEVKYIQALSGWCEEALKWFLCYLAEWPVHTEMARGMLKYGMSSCDVHVGLCKLLLSVYCVTITPTDTPFIIKWFVIDAQIYLAEIQWNKHKIQLLQSLQQGCRILKLKRCFAISLPCTMSILQRCRISCYIILLQSF